MEFNTRLQKILEYYQLSASAFSNSISVQRSSMSHILSGRNKPSLDFVMKVIKKYPEVDINWLVNGEGVFPKSNTPYPTSKKTNEENKTSDLFSESSATIKREKSDLQLSSIDTANKKLDRVILFYTDGSFDEYKN